MLSVLVNQAAILAGINPAIVWGIIKVESDFNPNAIRHESFYQWVHKPTHFANLLHIPKAGEEAFQMTSWGLMQVMGGTARVWGYKGHLTDLLKPETNLEVGCGVFAHFKKKYKNERDAISAYNWGHVKKSADGVYENQKYVNLVLSGMDTWKKDKASAPKQQRR